MSAGKHRAARPVRLRVNPLSFQPRHCAGTSCFHDHADDPRPSLGVHESVFTPQAEE